MPRGNNAEEIKKYYYSQTKNEVKMEPWNTGSNIARKIVRSDSKNRYGHAEGTIANYVRPIIKSHFVSSGSETQWMKLEKEEAKYLPLTGEQSEFLEYLFSHRVGDAEDLTSWSMQVMADIVAGYVDKEEAKEEWMSRVYKTYMQIMHEFREKFGFMPVKVRYLAEIENF